MANQQTQAQEETDQVKYERIMGNHADVPSYADFVAVRAVAVRNGLYGELKLTVFDKVHLEVIWSRGQQKQGTFASTS